jgi:hypothetical protein
VTAPEPFDPAIACIEFQGCPLVEPCTLRCHERFLNDEIQPNDAWANEENATAWRRYWDANPGDEEAMQRACDPQRALADHQAQLESGETT